MIRRVLLGAGLLVCAAALSGCLRISGTLPASASSVVATPTPTSAATQPITHGVVGEKLKMGAWTVTVVDAVRTPGALGGVKPPAGSDFVVVDIGFENKGTDALQVRPEDFRLTGPGGVVVPMATMTKPAFNASSMRPLLPGFGTSTALVYPVPKKADRYTLVFSPGGAGKKAQLEWQVP